MRARRRMFVLGTGAAIAALMTIPVVSAGATTCVVPVSMTEPGSCTVVPTVGADATTVSPVAVAPSSIRPSTVAGASTSPTASTTSLPFTGADVEELAAVGVGAVLAGGLLLRRRRTRA